ncbi:ataxin-7-like protein 2a [Hypomesus transpacificus]|uniref:ataxin-7-like protein 2a n=1 Tax=Hypomesus transpacificus TaxID=137520 RepID=UPI001F078C0F|nr:ataxin-7-like protein 2a [Hypomesus transpacificus]
MMAVRERAVKVMAALERRVPSLDDFVGQSWSAWAERAGVTASEGHEVEDCNKNGKKSAEAMSLRKEDMSIFGHYPGQDDFYLVVCSHCSQVVKPQAFEKHCERRHGHLGKLYARLRSPPSAQQQRPRHGHSPSSAHTNSASSSSWDGRSQGSGPPRAAPPSPSTPPQYRHSKTGKEGVRHSPLDKSSHGSQSESPIFKQPPPAEPPLSTPPPSLRDPPWPHGGTPPGRPSPSDRVPSQRKESCSAPSLQGHHRVPRPYNKVASRRECDLDKHCGVLDPERKKVCTRLLTCNIHSIHQRRKVVGRSKNFNQLVAELKTGARIRERGGPVSDGGGRGRSPSPETPRDRDYSGAPHCRRPLTNCPAFSRSRTSSESALEEDKPRQEESGVGALSPLTYGRISSDESEADGSDELAEYPSSATHPKPLARCSFGSHALGHGVYTFDRRLHHLRSALNNMVEQHLSGHLWKKIPQATDLQSHSPSTKTLPSSSPSSSCLSSLHSKVRTGSHMSSSLRTSISLGPAREPRGHLSTTTLSQSENSGSSSGQLVAPVTPAVRQTGPGRPKNPVGRPSKQMLRLREEAAAAAAAALRKRKASSQEGEHSGPDRNCIIPQDRGRPPSSSSSVTPKAAAPSTIPHGQTNGTLSPGGKLRPQPSPSESHSPSAAAWAFKRTHSSASSTHSSPPEATPTNSHSRAGPGGGDSGLHVRGGGGGYEHRGLVKKRKGGNNGEPSPPAKPSHRPPSSSSTSPRSNFYPWKDSKGGVLPGGVEKKLGTQKPKLHH